MRKLWRYLIVFVVLAAAFLYLNNTSLLAEKRDGSPTLLAHRGIAQSFDTRNLQNDTCTAERMLPPKHDYLENTIPSMRASFEAGADIVEIDIHPTTDGKFAVFHDWTLDCRTEGHGPTRDHAMAELKQLDIGYGYTANGGKTYPFRGKGVGLMPSLEEVLSAFPDKRFLINVKSNDPDEGRKLAARLETLSPDRRSDLMVYGGDRPVAELSKRLPDIKIASKTALKACLLPYIAYGWTGIVPKGCDNRLVLVPINIAPWLWGWPDRFLARMQEADASVFALGPYRGGGFSSGIDNEEVLERLPEGYAGGIWTNDIEYVAKTLKPDR